MNLIKVFAIILILSTINACSYIKKKSLLLTPELNNKEVVVFGINFLKKKNINSNHYILHHKPDFEDGVWSMYFKKKLQDNRLGTNGYSIYIIDKDPDNIILIPEL